MSGQFLIIPATSVNVSREWQLLKKNACVTPFCQARAIVNASRPDSRKFWTAPEAVMNDNVMSEWHWNFSYAQWISQSSLRIGIAPSNHFSYSTANSFSFIHATWIKNVFLAGNPFCCLSYTSLLNTACLYLTRIDAKNKNPKQIHLVITAYVLFYMQFFAVRFHQSDLIMCYSTYSHIHFCRGERMFKNAKHTVRK